MANVSRFTKDQILKAIHGSYGIYTNVAKRLHCDRQTATNNINKYPETKEAFLQEKETLLDLGENTIVELLQKCDGATVRWLMSTLGKNRGYTENEAQQKEANDTEYIFRLVDDSKQQ